MSLPRENLRGFFEASPTIRLLRSSLAPLVIDILNQSFKLSECLTLGLSDLKARLLCYQEELHQNYPTLMTGPAERYIADWVDSGWLQRFLEADSSEPQFQLTSHSEEAIRFAESAAARTSALVGTESRLKLIMETLADLVRGASADPATRLKYLYSQREQIDRQIAEIESGKSIQVYRPAQIRERFQTAVELLRALQSDFRAVEERFQQIARDVQQLQVSGRASRGQILGYALDSEDLLKQQDQGISFFAFVAFLLSPTQQTALRKSIEEIQRLDALRDQPEALQHLRRMMPALLAEAEKVMKTTARLSSTLRRLLDTNSTEHRLRLASLLQSIKQTALQLRQAPPAQFSFRLSAEADIGSPLARKFWTPHSVFEAESLERHVVDVAQAQHIEQVFASLKRLDFREMRRHIQHCTLQGSPVTLADLVSRSTGAPGIVELLGYAQIAHDDQHQIDPDRSQTLVVSLDQQYDWRRIHVIIPLITFLPKVAAKGRHPK